MFHIVLVSPEIPPNTGNVIRLAANSGASLHLVRPLGFDLDDKKLKRAGLDYHEWTRLQINDDLQLAFDSLGGDPDRRFALTTKGTRLIGPVPLQPGDLLRTAAEWLGEE